MNETIKEAFFGFYRSYAGGKKITDPHQVRDVELAFYSGYLQAMSALYEKGSIEIPEEDAAQWLTERCNEAGDRVDEIILEIKKERMG